MNSKQNRGRTAYHAGVAAEDSVAQHYMRSGLPVLARIKAYASAGVDPAIMGTGPICATTKALEKAGWTIADLDLVFGDLANTLDLAALERIGDTGDARLAWLVSVEPASHRAAYLVIVDAASGEILFRQDILLHGSGLAFRMGLPVPLSEPVSAGLLVAFIEYLDRLFRPLRELSDARAP